MISDSEKKDLLELRKRIFLTGYKGGMAHLASCFSCIDMIYALYFKDILKYDPKNPKWEDRDRFILSKGHGGLALYAVLEKAGLISGELLDSYLSEDSLIGGEPCMRDCEFIEATTGSLGHGLSFGLGIAMALKMNGSSSKVYVMLGDGELQEGSVWEAAMAASGFSLDNLIVIVDHNRIQKMDFVENTLGKLDWEGKFAAFGWAIKKTDGHDINEFNKNLDNLKDDKIASGRPKAVIADTVKGKGVSVMENDPRWHFRLPGKKDLKIFMEELDIAESELE